MAMEMPLSLTLYHFGLSDSMEAAYPLSEEEADATISILQQYKFFNWTQSHNFCESRAEAVSLLLTAGGIPHAKAWVFGAAFLQKGYVGGLKNNWNYHVAIAIPVKVDNGYLWMVFDPALHEGLVILESWASGITAYPHSYHFLKAPEYYIFPKRNITTAKWYKRSQRNFRWTLQGLLGIHALDPAGKSKLAFQKKRIKIFSSFFSNLLKAYAKNKKENTKDVLAV